MQTGLTIRTADGSTYKPSRMSDVDIIRYTMAVWDTCPKYAVTMFERTMNHYADRDDIVEICKLCKDHWKATHLDVA